MPSLLTLFFIHFSRFSVDTVDLNISDLIPLFSKTLLIRGVISLVQVKVA